MSSLGRVVQACARCRRQKLKCDATRPCTLCLRANVECQPRQVLGKRKSVTGGHAHTRDNTLPREPSIAALSTSEPSERDHQQRHRFDRERRTSEDVVHATSPTEGHQYGANSSVINFARHVARDHDLESPEMGSTIPGDAGEVRETSSAWRLQKIRLPSKDIMIQLVQAYFDRVHWFIFILHPSTFMAKADTVLSKPRWTRRDLPDVIVVLAVAAMGLKCVLHDSSWAGHAQLRDEGIIPENLLADLITETRTNVLDVVDAGQIESVQVCLILGTYLIYSGSAHSAWSILSLAISSVYALALHCEVPSDDLDVAAQIRRRTWNHAVIADTFSSMIYGRPTSLDSAFARAQPLHEMDDTVIDGPLGLSGEAVLSSGNRSALAFHILRYKLYSINKHALSTFRLLRLGDVLSEDELESLVESVKEIEHLLAEWRKNLPTYLTMEHYDDGLEHNDPLQPRGSPGTIDEATRKLMLQAIVLQITYDSTVIFVRRPLIEHKVATKPSGSLTSAAYKYRQKSLSVAVDAALRISRLPLAELDNSLALSFLFMHFFTAGVILCIIPPTEPFSARSQESKAGVMRIIRASRVLGSNSKIGKHLDELLTALLSATIQRELNTALDPQTVMLNAEHLAQSSTLQNSDLVLGQTESSQPLIPGELSQDRIDEGLAPSPRDMSGIQDSSEISFSGQQPQQDYHSAMLSQLEDSNFQFDAHLDETFGAFGQVMFNLLPDDPYTPWNWGGSLR
ncbi:hypothetical protein B0A52_03494 [Exophiala mesophila]|uniref:Zn(2)-C6 fungal-type domain-containing protein n=1 Tax=Exophiala mesophila TaxID=212818 RepID=A0A438N5W4_EXOME|nr:hypothetical protein B0A52_03494 [Exophiala mesophila]